MNSTTLFARTVSIVKPYAVETLQGSNGEFEKKSILFRIAVDRDYTVQVTENGVVGKKHPTDFWLAKATGEVAERFNQYCTAKDANGKLVSRFLALGGNFEQYQKPRSVTLSGQVNCGGALYNVELTKDIPDTPTIFIVNDIRFLDSSKKNEQAAQGTAGAVTANATPVGVAQPQAAQTAAPVAQPAAAPVAQQPVAAAPVQQATPVAQAAPVAQTAQPVATGAMNPPAGDVTPW